MITRSFIALALAGGASLAAQSLKPGLALIPATVEDVEIYLRPVEIEANGKALIGLMGKEESFTGLSGKVGLDPADLSPGAAFIAEYPTAPAKKDAAEKDGKEGPKAPAPFLAVLPAAHGEALLARLHGKLKGGAWTYTLPHGAGADSGTKAGLRFAALRPGYLLVAGDRATLEAALVAKQMLAAEVDGPLEAWLQSHDASLLVSGEETRSNLTDMVRGLEKPQPAASPLASLTPRIKALALKAQASVTHFALGFDASKDGTVRVAGRAFYRAGSPLAQDAAALAPMGAHPLANLPQDPFALAFGGQWPDAFNFIATDPETALAAYKGHTLPEDLKAKFTAAMKVQLDQVQSMSMLMGPPSKSGDPLMKGAVAVIRVKDAEAYREAQARVTALQEEMARATGTAIHTTLDKDVLPGVPSFTLTTDLAQAPNAQGMAPQASMVFGFLFGGTVMRQSYGQLDAHTWLSVFGSGEDLQWALMRAKQSAALPEMPTVKREDELLPAASRFSLYLDIKGLRDMAQMVMSAMGQGQKELPAVPRVPPFGIAFTCDPGGFEVRGGAHPESLKAMRDLVAEVSKARPQSGTQE
jgi:hypothetical protein